MTDTSSNEPPAGFRARMRAAAADLPPFGLADQGRLIVHLLRWIVFGAVSGVLAGVSSWALLEALIWATRSFAEHGWLLYLLPLAGLAIGFVYWRFAGRAASGNNVLIDEIHTPTEWVPRRMAPLIFAATVVTHLFGGSAGREGTAIQMSGSLTDWFSRTIKLDQADRRILLIASISGGFGAMFGVPLAGTVFGLEVQAVGRVRYEALVPALTASVVGDQVVRALGFQHEATPQLLPSVDPWLLARVAIAGLVFAMAGAVFIDLTHAIKRLMAAAIPFAPLRPMVGGVAIIVLSLIFGRQELGLSLPLAAAALSGQDVGLSVSLLKILFTAVTLGTGFQGGEVTPLFIVGATLGAALAPVLGIPVSVLAAIGYVAVFAGASNTPLACTIMGVELFGSGMVVPIAVGCVVAYVFSSHRSLYGSQRVAFAKGGLAVDADAPLDRHRRHALRWPWRRPD
jgi:H+/Cl- antiporter ClcA